MCLVDDGAWCGKGVGREGDVWLAGWLAGWLGCVSVWVIAAGQERSPVHGAGLV